MSMVFLLRSNSKSPSNALRTQDATAALKNINGAMLEHKQAMHMDILQLNKEIVTERSLRLFSTMPAERLKRKKHREKMSARGFVSLSEFILSSSL